MKKKTISLRGEIIIEVAKLDYPDHLEWYFHKKSGDVLNDDLCKVADNYLTSRDAIIPVIEKYIRAGNYNNLNLTHAFIDEFGDPCNWQDVICATPHQLCIALLKATGKYKD